MTEAALKEIERKHLCGVEGASCCVCEMLAEIRRLQKLEMDLRPI